MKGSVLRCRERPRRSIPLGVSDHWGQPLACDIKSDVAKACESISATDGKCCGQFHELPYDPGGARCFDTLCLHQLGTSPQTFEFYNRAILANFLDVVAWNRAILANVLDVDVKNPAILANFLNVAVQG